MFAAISFPSLPDFLEYWICFLSNNIHTLYATQISLSLTKFQFASQLNISVTTAEILSMLQFPCIMWLPACLPVYNPKNFNSSCLMYFRFASYSILLMVITPPIGGLRHIINKAGKQL